ncbi:MAG: 2-C-methyl-D-erythritol 4-phosphate cytidylyltransferase, partial [Candidatus Scatovivens sp.]
MNIVMIMSGGVGKRFGASIPKQYVKLNGKPVIDYVVSAVKKSKLTDKIVVVIDKEYINYSEILKQEDSKIVFADNGKERYDSVKNGFDFIKHNYRCDKVLIADAVAPFIYPEL